VSVSLALVLLLAGYVLAFPPRSIEGTMLASCPTMLAGMPGKDLPLEQAVLDDLDPDDHLLRLHERPDGLPVWLVVTYFQNARLGAHDPYLCYRSQGFQIAPLPDGHLETALGPVHYKMFEASNGRRQELVLYFWYTSGGRVLAEVGEWRDQMFLQGLRSNRSFGAFVRISTIVGDDRAAAEGAILSMVTDLAPRLPGLFPEDD